MFNSVSKATSFLSGAKVVIREGIVPFKARMRADADATREVFGRVKNVDELESVGDLPHVLTTLEALPGIGKITKFHLAKNIGLLDVAKPDIWLCRASILCGGDVGYPTVSSLVEGVSEQLHINEMCYRCRDLALRDKGRTRRVGWHDIDEGSGVLAKQRRNCVRVRSSRRRSHGFRLP